MNHRRRKAAQTFEGLLVSAGVLQTGRAGKRRQPGHAIDLAVRPGAARFGRTEQRHDGFAHRRRDVHRPGIVRHQQFTEPDPFNHRRQRCPASQIETPPRFRPRDPFAQSGVGAAAQNGKAQIAVIAGQTPHQLGEILDRPAFVVPTRARLQRQPTRGVRAPRLLDRGLRLRPNRQPGEIPMHRHPQMAEHFQVPIHRVRVKTRPRHGQIVKSARPFAGVVQPDREVAIGQPGEQPAARETLQIDHPVKLKGAHLAHAGQHFVPV